MTSIVNDYEQTRGNVPRAQIVQAKLRERAAEGMRALDELVPKLETALNRLYKNARGQNAMAPAHRSRSMEQLVEHDVIYEPVHPRRREAFGRCRWSRAERERFPWHAEPTAVGESAKAVQGRESRGVRGNRPTEAPQVPDAAPNRSRPRFAGRDY